MIFVGVGTLEAEGDGDEILEGQFSWRTGDMVAFLRPSATLVKSQFQRLLFRRDPGKIGPFG